MRQYCRYCAQACAQTEDTAYCDHLGAMVRKTARSVNCDGYEFCKVDAFYGFRGLEPDDPRCWYKPRDTIKRDGAQISLGEYVNDTDKKHGHAEDLCLVQAEGFLP